MTDCEEINKAIKLLPKIIGFISSIHGTTVVKWENIATSLLKLIAKLASVKGKISVTFCQKLTKNPFLIGNLIKILEMEDSSSYLELSKFAMDIISDISMDKKNKVRRLGKS